MTDSISQETEAVEASGVTESQEAEVVSKKAYLEVSEDMHKYKATMKTLETELADLKAAREAEENEKLAAENRYKELYEKEINAKKSLQEQQEADRKKYLNTHKVQAVTEELGGLKRSEYSKFINTDAVQLDDNGQIVKESLEAEVARIKQDFPELLKGQSVNKLPSEAPKRTEPAAEKSLNSMSKDDLLAAYSKKSKK